MESMEQQHSHSDAGEMLLQCKLLISSKEDKEKKYLSQNAAYNLTHDKNTEQFTGALTFQTSINMWMGKEWYYSFLKLPVSQKQ